MPITHKNRKGDVYYLHAGVTKTGKPRYHFSRKDQGTLADEIPPGYEIYEKPDSAQVYLRKERATAITPAEREFTQAECRRLGESQAILVDVEDNSLVIYTSDGTDDRLAELLGGFGMSSSEVKASLEWRASRAHYTKMMRFTLIDEDRRLFSVDRWCFRGAIDDWFPVASRLPLETAVERYAPHLMRESFFELM